MRLLDSGSPLQGSGNVKILYTSLGSTWKSVSLAKVYNMRIHDKVLWIDCPSKEHILFI